MHLFILFIFLGLAAIIVWVADWTTVPGRRGPTAVDVLNRRLARGEIDRAEYEEKRKLLGRSRFTRPALPAARSTRRLLVVTSSRPASAVIIPVAGHGGVDRLVGEVAGIVTIMPMRVAVVARKIGVPSRWWVSSSGRAILSRRDRGSAQH
jgi:hypothetical protein